MIDKTPPRACPPIMGSRRAAAGLTSVGLPSLTTQE